MHTDFFFKNEIKYDLRQSMTQACWSPNRLFTEKKDEFHLYRLSALCLISVQSGFNFLCLKTTLVLDGYVFL